MRLNKLSSASTILAEILALVALVAAVPALSQENPADDQTETKLVDDPMGVFQSIELAWQRGDAQAVAVLASQSPTFIDLKGTGRKGGYYTRPQVTFIFKQMFDGTSQLGFQFVKYRNLENPDRRVYGIAHRKYKSARRGGIFEDTVYVTLVKEEARWAVAEIKSTW